MFFMDNPAMEIWASLTMFKLKSLNLKFPPLFKACYIVGDPLYDIYYTRIYIPAAAMLAIASKFGCVLW